ncbi:hypothetical protein FYU92_06485 [Vibrio cholerae]|jgi:antitoxin component of RelBE/YafQ-DinJ toxin-antitoxin module|uniref:hypothetical protein n=1 Tax=Vibrio TaxID=662 RepID=UPI0003578566|nr:MULTISPECIES: hypothetical protein [Vibrio]EGQ9843722.1 hypothetical protein [Vibrio cholerae]EGR1038377.1 hypothetical protein [Vibrio cholerae]EJL6714162.1 hypothetical protein [Vibrio cholerae]EKO3963146.1 hypothetical protein [Vibrio fluvialis]EPP22393.1 hypothetical protein L911_2201 [Vibrio fluvialis I21563]
MSKRKSDDSVISTRDQDLKNRLQRIVEIEDRNIAQMVRIMLRKAIEEKEKELGLAPLEKVA